MITRGHYLAAIKSPRCWLYIGLQTGLGILATLAYPMPSPTTLTTWFIAAFGSWMAVYVFASDAERTEYRAERDRADAARREQHAENMKRLRPVQDLIQHHADDLNSNGHASRKRAV